MRVSARLSAPLRHPVAMRLVVLAGFVLALSQALSPTTFRLDAGDVTIDPSPSVPGGKLSLDLGPFGMLTWRTHSAPLDINTRFVLARKISGVPELDEAADLRWKVLARKIPWLLAAGLLLGIALARDPASPGWRAPVAGATGLLAVAAAIIGASILTFNSRALSHPEYTGPINDAPRVVALLQEAHGDLAGVTRNINKTIAGLVRIHSQIVEQAAAPPESTTKLLVMSDIHNNPLGLLIAKELAERFGADALLNAGDFTDRGSPPEAALFARFAAFGVPHVFVGGNHEDTSVLARASSIPASTLLDAQRDADVVTVAGIEILGDTDPSARSVSSDPFDLEARAEVEERCRAMAVRMLEVRPHVVLVHDPLQGRCAAELAESSDIPLVFVAGHTHKQLYEEHGSAVWVNPGTSGANGIKTGRPAAYGFALLEFDRTTGSLATVCLFNFDGPAALRNTSCHIGRASSTSASRAAGGE